MKTLAVFGGTFNPFHIGHKQILEAICELKWVDKVLIIPSKIPPHKSVDFLASDIHRINMCKLASQKYSKASVSELEILRVGKSYTVDTLSDIRELYPEYEIALTVGGDMITSFTEWKDYNTILKSTKLIAFSRVGTQNEDFINAVEGLKNCGADINVLDTEITEISSTIIRNNINNRSFCEKFLSEDILNYIYDNNVYGDQLDLR